jgi:hypothetical protein
MTFTVPSDALPDTVGKFDLRVTSQNDSTRFDVQEIEVSASMISSADVMMNYDSLSSEWSLKPGESKVIYYTIWNNATSQDIFIPTVEVRDIGQWIIQQPSQSNLVINSGKQSSFSIIITVPEQSQVGDVCPKITPTITSVRSGEVFSGNEFDGMEISRQDDLTISLIDEPSVYHAGKDNLVSIEIQNKGNGPNQANIDVEGLPNDWSWEILVDTNVIENPISLSAIYDLDDVKQVQISISPNSTTLAGSMYQYTIKVSSFDGTIDNNYSDNEIELQTVISTNHNIVISSQSSQIFTGIGNYTTVNASIQNLGNINEYNVMIRAQVSIVSSNEQLNPYFTIGQNGIIFDLDTYQSLNLEIGQLYELKVAFQIPENLDIGTRIIVKFDVQSTNNSGLIFQTSQAMIELDYRRSMDVDLFTTNSSNIDESNGARAFVNLSSTSTVSETYTLNLLMPELWQAVCSGVILDADGMIIENSPGYIQEQFTSTSCEIYPLDGVDSGNVVFNIQNEDGTLEWEESIMYKFKRNSEDSFSLSTNMIAGSIAGLLAIAIITVLVIRTRNNNFQEEDVTIENSETTRISGPPVSGPPVSIQPNTNEKITNNSEMKSGSNQGQMTNFGPPIPQTGLPEGWTQEQWNYYGQKYLDKLNTGER